MHDRPRCLRPGWLWWLWVGAVRTSFSSLAERTSEAVPLDREGAGAVVPRPPPWLWFALPP